MSFCILLLFLLSFHHKTVFLSSTLGVFNEGPKTFVLLSWSPMSFSRGGLTLPVPWPCPET